MNSRTFNTEVFLHRREKERSVLIVDDDFATTQLFRIYLKSEFKGRVLLAYNGIEAVEKCLEHWPDLVFMDINMPYMDGIAATEKIRAAGYTNPILVVTAYGQSEYVGEYLRAGADAIIPKPVRRAEFISQLRRFLKDVESRAV